jgi:hypothetical protein
MSKPLVILGAAALLSMIAWPSPADAGRRAYGFKTPGVYEVSAQKRRYACGYYYARRAPYPYSDPCWPPAPYIPLAPQYRLGPIVPWWW